MSKYESFKEFAVAVKKELESMYEADVHLDELALENTDGEQVGFQRDDLYRFMLVLPNGEDWEPSKLYAYLPSEKDQIADRPGVPSRQVEVSISEVVEMVDDVAPEYSGPFVYENNQ